MAGSVIQTCMFYWFSFDRLVLLITEKDVLKYTTVIVDLSSSLFSSLSFYFVCLFFMTLFFVALEIFHIVSFLFLSALLRYN